MADPTTVPVQVAKPAPVVKPAPTAPPPPKRKPSVPSNESASSPKQQCGKLYAALYYQRSAAHPKPDDHAFRAAANTFIKKMKKNHYAGYTAKLKHCKGDITMVLPFHDEKTYRAAWKKINKTSQVRPAYGVGVFSHHGREGIQGWNATANQDSHVIDSGEVASLAKLNWVPKKGFMYLGMCSGDKDNLAKTYSHKQNVRVFSSRGYALFSRRASKYESTKSTYQKLKEWVGITPKSVAGEVYLRSYVRTMNLLDPDAKGIEGSAVIPETIHGTDKSDGLE